MYNVCRKQVKTGTCGYRELAHLTLTVLNWLTRFHQVKCIFLPTTFHVNSWNNMLLISSK